MTAAQARAESPPEPSRIRSSSRRFVYKRHEPEATVLYRIVHQHLEPFLAHARETYQRPLPAYVERELRAYLRCGILEHGFSRIQCPQCQHEFLVAHSCKGRGLCPSCSTRRMTATAAHMATKVLPDVPIRQWVLSVPWEIRGLLAARATVLSSVLRIFLSVVAGWYKSDAKLAAVAVPQPGAVAFVQRFGGSLNLHVHYHVACLDGAYCKTEDDTASFRVARAPSQSDILHVAAETGRRVKRMLLRQGLIVAKPADDDPDAPPESAIDACMQTALSLGTFQRIEDDRVVDTPADQDDARFDHRKQSPWSAEADGFSVHAGVLMRAGDAEGRERLIRYCARPTLSLERLSVLKDGRIAYRSKYPRRGGKSHRILGPMEFMARIAALIPPPRHALVRYSGVLAPASKWRPLVVPAAPARPCEHQQPQARPSAGGAVVAKANSADKASEAPARPTAPRAPRAHRPGPVLVRVGSLNPFAHVGDTKPQPASPDKSGKFRGRRSTSYIDWGTLMKRSMGIDVLACPKCGHGRMRPIADITEREVINKIMTHLRLPLVPEVLGDGAVVYDITGAPVLEPDWRPGGAWWERGPPGDWDGIDAPAPDG